MIPGMVGKIAEAPTAVAAATMGPFFGELVYVTGSTVIATIKPPNNGGWSGILLVVPAVAVDTTTVGGNILTASTLPANKVTVLVWVDSLQKWALNISA